MPRSSGGFSITRFVSANDRGRQVPRIRPGEPHNTLVGKSTATKYFFSKNRFFLDPDSATPYRVGMVQKGPIAKRVNGAKIAQYRSLISCMAAFFRCPPSKIPTRGNWEGYDRNGRKVRRSMKEVLRLHRDRGCWGWVEHHRTLHLWVSRKASFSEAVALVAHELGHLERPWGHGSREEKKAARYEAVAQNAVDLLAVLRKRPRTKRKRP